MEVLAWVRFDGDIVQSSLWCNHRAIQLKKVLKKSEKILNVHLNLLHLYIKFQGQIRPPLEVTKKTNLVLGIAP